MGARVGVVVANEEPIQLATATKLHTGLLQCREVLRRHRG
jgi:hypothetical protein